jgi:hypothetical protein
MLNSSYFEHVCMYCIGDCRHAGLCISSTCVSAFNIRKMHAIQHVFGCVVSMLRSYIDMFLSCLHACVYVCVCIPLHTHVYTHVYEAILILSRTYICIYIYDRILFLLEQGGLHEYLCACIYSHTKAIFLSAVE